MPRTQESGSRAGRLGIIPGNWAITPAVALQSVPCKEGREDGKFRSPGRFVKC